MDRSEKIFKNFMKAERKYINDAKYFEGINTKKDPGEMYIIAWIRQNAEEFRIKWDISKCKECNCAGQCGDKLKIQCDKFNELTD